MLSVSGGHIEKANTETHIAPEHVFTRKGLAEDNNTGQKRAQASHTAPEGSVPIEGRTEVSC